MKHTHIGTKMIRATPMTRADYNTLRGWELPANERGEDDGYLVEYLDGGQANQAGFDGYVSWSPRDVFDRAYRPATGLSFGMALEAVKLGRCVARAGWNGKGMWLAIVNAGQYDVAAGIAGDAKFSPWIAMKTADNKLVPWLASQTDMLAEDWTVLP